MNLSLKSTITTGQTAPENWQPTTDAERQWQGVAHQEQVVRISATQAHWLLMQALQQAQPVLEQQPTTRFDAQEAAGHVGTQAAVAQDAVSMARALVAEARANA